MENRASRTDSLPFGTKMKAVIRCTQYYLPQAELTTSQLREQFPHWGVEKIDRRIGIERRRIASEFECASDLACEAAKRLMAEEGIEADSIDCLLFCTQTPDYHLPATACLLQSRLGLPKKCFAIDIYQGCSGFVYSMGLANGLVESGQVSRVLLLCGDTITKLLNPEDRGVRTVFGDAGTATLIDRDDSIDASIGPFIWGTDGRGEKNLIVQAGGARQAKGHSEEVSVDEESGLLRRPDQLYMNGAEIFEFTLAAVPKAFHLLLDKARLSKEDVDLFFFHQANRYMLYSLRKSLGIPEDKFVFAMDQCGNTSSSSIPIAIRHTLEDGRLRTGSTIMLLGFGVGYSWAGAMVKWG